MLIIISVIAANFLGIFGQGPKVAKALIPVAVDLSIPQIISDILHKFLVTQWTELQKHWRDIIVAIVISKLQRDIVAKINGESGGNGPSYIENWGQYLQQAAADVAVNEAVGYVSDISNGNINLCAPLGPQLQIRLGILAQHYGYGGSGADYYGVPTYCSFDDIKRNLESPNGPLNLFSNMGWSAFDAIVSPSVDPILAWAQVEDMVSVRIGSQQEIAKTQAQSSQGFKPNQRCTDQKALARAEWTCEGDPEKDACVAYAVQSECTSWETITPGSVAAGAVMEAVGANFQYSTNVQSALAAIINALASRILSEGLSRISSNDSRWSVSGSNQGIESGDIPSGINDERIEANKQQLADAKKMYDDALYYLDNVLVPKVDKDLALASGFNDTCPSSTITIDEGGSTVEVPIAELYGFISDFKSGFLLVRDQASSNLDEINNIDYSDDSAVSQAVTKYSNFINADANKMIVSGVLSSAAGQAGTLETMLDSIYSSLSSFSC
jgi:hypothetical protein